MCRTGVNSDNNLRVHARRKLYFKGNRGRIDRDPVRALRIRHFIERCVVAVLGLSGRPEVRSAIAGPPRSGTEVVFARQVVMYLAHVGCGLSFTATARLYARHRSTAAYACAVVEGSRDDTAFDRVIEQLERFVRLGVGQIEPQLAAELATVRQRR